VVAWSRAENWGPLALLLCLQACSSESLSSEAGPSDTGVLGGQLLSVPVPETSEVLVDLATPSVLAASDTRAALGWDLGFQGFDVLTNGGVSGSGAGAAFGALSAPVFLSDTAPAVPFLTPDQAGGAFRRWFAYDAEEHVVLSRFHVFGVRDGERSFKVQVLSYYGGRSLDTAAHYSLRYAEVSDSGVAETLEFSDVDATAGNDAKNPDAPSSCVDFASGELLSLTPAEASTSRAWHLCFRRDAISVNGGRGGPRGVTAVDLDAALTASETAADLRARSAESEAARFDAIGAAELAAASADFRPDGLVTAFTDRWLSPGAKPPRPESGVWLVLGADGASHFLVMFEGFDGASEAGPGTIRLRLKAVL
jgi:hypothetical protein